MTKMSTITNIIMKKSLIFSFGLAALLFAGCSTDPQELDYIAPQGAPRIQIEGSIEQDYLTRVDDNGFCEGDQVGLYGVNYTDENTLAGTLLDSGNQVDNARFTYDAANNAWISSGSIYYKDAETNIDLYAYYPYANPQSVNNYEFEVAQDQSGATVIDGYAQSDFLWGKVTNVAPSEQRIKLRFHHYMACANVVLTEGTGFAEGEFDALEKGVKVVNTTRKATIDLATATITATGEPQSDGILMKNGTDGFRAIVVPQTVEAATPLFVITLDGINYRYKYSNANVEYQQGLQTKFTIRINKKAVTGDYELALDGFEITEWVADVESHGGEARQYYVVHLDEAGTLEAKIAEAKKNPAKIKNLKVSGKIDKRDFYFMRDKMSILQAVNLKEAEIVGGWRYHVNVCENNTWSDYHDEYFGGEMPESDAECQAMVRERYPNATEIHWSSRYVDSYPNEIPSSAFSGRITLVYFAFPEVVTKIGSSAFSGTLLSGALVIPNDVVEIGNNAFSGTNITSLQLPHKLKVLGSSVFSGCYSLSGTLSLPESLESIGDRCFMDCAMLTGNLVLPHKLTTIPDWCFHTCKGFTGNLVIHEGVTSIGEYAFSKCEGLKGSLSLPNSLKTIDICAFAEASFQGELIIPAQIQKLSHRCFDDCDFSSVVFADNSELIIIEGGTGSGGWEGAFARCSRISEPIVLPESLISIEGHAFYQCSNLPAITIPKNVTVIGIEAFVGCSCLNAITCEAKLPPICGSGAFDGVAKDNFTVEVPEESVAKYQTATGWADFRRIAAHYDFSFSRSKMRVLNAQKSNTYLLRAPSGYAWSVDTEALPDWITVTPSTGVGKTDITVTVAEMTDADVVEFESLVNGTTHSYTKHSGRKGEVVVRLNDKDYSTRLVVEQFDSDVADGDVIVNQAATVGGGVNIVFMGDCFDAKDIAEGKYLDGVNEAIGYYFAIEPYKSYKEYFNIYTVVGMSPDSGMGTVNTIKDAKFGSQYSLNGIMPDTKITYEYAMKAETVNESNLNQTLVVMVENTTEYGGICYMWSDGSAIAICPMSRDAYPFDFRGIVQHEAGGHGFAKLADEYIYHNAFIQDCKCTCCDHLDAFLKTKALGWYRNLSTNGDMKTVEWAHLIYHPKYSNIVDMYEGGYFHTRGIYRSEGNSCMNNNVPYYSAISRQEMVERIMKYAGEQFSITSFYDKDVVDASNNDFTTSAAMVLAGEPTMENMASAAKQMAPVFMGEKPILK